MTVWEFMIDLNKVCCFMSRERTGRASNSEIKRWIQNKAIIIDWKRVAWDEEIKFPISSLVMFPKHRVTIF